MLRTPGIRLCRWSDTVHIVLSDGHGRTAARESSAEMSFPGIWVYIIFISLGLGMGTRGSSSRAMTKQGHAPKSFELGLTFVGLNLAFRRADLGADGCGLPGDL